VAIPSRLRSPRRPIGLLAMTFEISHVENRYQTMSLIGMTYIYAWLYNRTGSVFFVFANNVSALVFAAMDTHELLTLAVAVMPWVVVLILRTGLRFIRIFRAAHFGLRTFLGRRSIHELLERLWCRQELGRDICL
jgi:hypothetical protein